MKGSHQPIGVYGNGFKSGSMRLGRDALIFTKNGGCQSVGMLSQSFLQAIKAQAVIVPIAPFNQQTNILETPSAVVVTDLLACVCYECMCGRCFAWQCLEGFRVWMCTLNACVCVGVGGRHDN